MKFIPALILAGALSPFTGAQAYEVTLSFTNLSGPNGAALSPIFVALGNGSFNPFTSGTAASTAIQTLSETGSGSGLATQFATVDAAGWGGEVTASTNAFGPGIYLPGGTGSNVWDAGAVVAQIAGAAFLAGNSGTSNTAENGVIQLINATNSSANSFAVYAGQTTADGYQFTQLPNSGSPLLGISAVSAVPLPPAAWLFGSALSVLGLTRSRKKVV